jgi:hypothetical protein
MSVSKIQIGQLWKKDGTGDIYLVTRLYSEAGRIFLGSLPHRKTRSFKLQIERTSIFTMSSTFISSF